MLRDAVSLLPPINRKVAEMLFKHLAA